VRATNVNLLVSLLVATSTTIPAQAEELHDWHAELHVDYVRLGPAERPTGGLELGGVFGRRWRWGGSSIELGGELSSFGFDTGARWAAVLGGLRVAGWQQIRGPVGGGLVLHLDAGRLPACAAWGLCGMFDGIYPAVDAGLRYEPSSRVSLLLLGGSIWVNTLPWSGAALRAGIAGTIAF
jgi:hypothetical protein